MFYVVAKRVSLDGYPEQYTVSRSNMVIDQFNEAMLFDTEAEAWEWTKSKEAAEWKYCTFDVRNTADL